MITRPQRHERIARIIQEHTIWSQQELAERLAKAGFAVTQATLSRDLTRMGVLKGPAGYVLPEMAAAGATAVNHRRGAMAVAGHAAGAGVNEERDMLLERALRRELRAIDAAGNLIVIRTDAGHANALAVEIDRIRMPEVLGTIAGDDTVFLALRSAAAAGRIARRFRSVTTNN
jgi:transcriptional regulator of arginine metabolism